MSGGTLRIGHDWHLAPANFSASGGTVEWTGQVGNAGPGGFPGGAGAYQFFNVLIDAGVDPGFDNQANNFVVLGNWTNNGSPTFTQNTTGVSFDGVAAQTIGGSSATTFDNLAVSNALGVVLATTTTVNGTLSLTRGVVNTGTNALALSTAAVVAGGSAASYVNGTLRKSFGSGNGQSFAFPLGDASTYAPVSLTAINVTAAGSLTARTTPGQHPCIANSAINPAKDVCRYWTLTNSPAGIGVSSATATFNFVPGDVSPGANTASFVVKRYCASWFATTPGTLAPTSATITGLAGFGDFVVGDPGSAAPTLTSCAKQSNGCAIVGLAGVAGWTYTIQASTNLVTWTNLGTATAATNGLCQFQDTNAQSFPQRFYRVVYP